MSVPELAHLPANCSASDIIAACEELGGVIVDGWLGQDLLDRFNAELEPWLEQHPGTDSGSEESDDFLGLRTRRLQGLCVKTPAFIEILTDQRLNDFAQATVGTISPTLIMNNGEVIDIGPGESAQPLHRDDDAWNFARTEAPMMINTITALVDITAAMGATHVVPGSHRWPKDRVPKPHEIVRAQMPAGASLFFRGDTLHCGGANETEQNRRALSLGICCGWLRPVENSYMNVPVEVARRLPEAARALLGYTLYDASAKGGGYLGYFDMGDPARVFDEPQNP